MWRGILVSLLASSSLGIVITPREDPQTAGKQLESSGTRPGSLDVNQQATDLQRVTPGRNGLLRKALRSTFQFNEDPQANEGQLGGRIAPLAKRTSNTGQTSQSELTDINTSLATTDGIGHALCALPLLFVGAPPYNTPGRLDITDDVNRGRTRNNLRFGDLSIVVDVRSTAVQSHAGWHVVQLHWYNNTFEGYTVLVEQFRSDQNPRTDQPEESTEITLPRARPGPIFDNPGEKTVCFDAPPGKKWVLQVRGRT